MPIILAIETATATCSIALFKGEKALCSFAIDLPRIHAQAIAPIVSTALEHTNLSFAQLSAVAVSKGPGSYTGLRIGVSFAKGICFAHNIPLIGINTLSGMAIQVHPFLPKNAVICPTIDARRDEVFTKLFQKAGDSLVPLTDTVALTVAELAERCASFDSLPWVLGDGAEKIMAYAPDKFLSVANPFATMDAKGVGTLAYQKFQKQEFEDLASFEPFYLKEFIAGKPKRSPFVTLT